MSMESSIEDHHHEDGSTGGGSSCSTAVKHPTGSISHLSTPHGHTTFRNMSLNSVAVVPLLSSHTTTTNSSSSSNSSTSHSTQSYHEFMTALSQHPYCGTYCGSSDSGSDSGSGTHSSDTTTSAGSTGSTHSTNNTTTPNHLTLVIPNHTLTRPSDWKYETTPFHSFHWNDGCQRLIFHDGRPIRTGTSSSSSIDSMDQNDVDVAVDDVDDDQSLYYHYTATASYRNYVDLYPHRRTAAIIGILNIQDCIIRDGGGDDKNDETPKQTTAMMIQRACEELQQWSHRYSSPSYGASTYGHTDDHGTSSSSTGTGSKDTTPSHRDVPVTRLFVYDSFNIDTPDMIFDIPKTQTGTILFDTNAIIAFPPNNNDILHTKFVLADLMVTIFRNLEQKVVHATRCIQALSSSSSDGTTTTETNDPTTITTTTGLARRSLARFVATTSGGPAPDTTRQQQQQQRPTLGVNQLADFVDPESALAKTSPRNDNNNNNSNTSDDASGNTATLPSSSTTTTTTTTTTTITTSSTSSFIHNSKSVAQSSTSVPSSSSTTIMSKLFQLTTPLDDELMTTVLLLESPTTTTTTTTPVIGPKDVEALKKREMGRRYKYIGDCCILAGTPLDAYEHYLKAMELCKGGGGGGGANSGSSSATTGSVHDPLWYAATLESCAVAHIVMAEIGGYGVDEYLENNFQLPEEIMALARDETTSRKVVANKQTLPEVVFALCDEALNILNRHEKLANLSAETILKLAMYTAEEAESHLRCRWGEGINCYAGEGENGQQPKRWEKTSVSKLKFSALRTKDGYSMIAINTHNRMKKLCALLSAAASIGSLDPPTRVDVAVRCARICLFGVKPTHWKGPVPERTKLPRKAAFFTVVAADALADQNHEIGSSARAQNLWLLASYLYSCKPNPIDGGGDYGWASLRAFCFDCLSTQGNSDLSLEAADQLLALLGHLNPVTSTISDYAIDISDRKPQDEGSLPTNDEPIKEYDTIKEVPRAAISLEDPEFKDALTTANQFAKNLRVTYNNLTAGSQLLVQQSKWASEKPIPSIDVPLSATSTLSPHLISLQLVWSQMSYDVATLAQKRCIERAALLRRTIPKRSAHFATSTMDDFNTRVLPVYISSDVVVEPAPQLDLECIKKRLPSSETTGGGLETFYNPFAKKTADNGPIARVVEGEERVVSLHLGNRLAVPLHVQQSQVEFDDNTKVKRRTLSFVIPPNANGFVVEYPFQVASNDNEFENCYSLQLKGVNIMCLGQHIFLPLKANKHTPAVIAKPSMLHLPLTSDEKKSDDSPADPFIECYACQPNLRMMYAGTNAPVPDVIPVALADGEIHTLPPIQLYNSTGQNTGANIECLEISVTGALTRKLYDSSIELMPQQSLDDFAEAMVYDQDPSPFKIRTLANELKIAAINKERDVSNGSNVVVFEIAASSTLRNRLPDGCAVNIIFRYRGTGTSTNDLWRKRTITLQIAPVQGPRILSIEFRPDLMMNHLSFTNEICQKWTRNTVLVEIGIKPGKATVVPTTKNHNPETMQRGVGCYPVISVCGSRSVFILSVQNESHAEIVVRLKDGPTEGTSALTHLTMLNELTIRPGAIAKFPMIVSRIVRFDENDSPINLVAAFSRLTTLKWKSSIGQGYICIPPSCLHNILYHQCPASISQICTPPVSIELNVHTSDATKTTLATTGEPIALTMQATLSSWLPADLLQQNNLCMSMEFRCQRQDRVSLPHEFVWVGKLKRTLSWHDQVVSMENLRHATKLVLTVPGTFIVSGLVRIYRYSKSATTNTTISSSTNTVELKGHCTTENEDEAGEVWWSPSCHVIRVS